MIMQSQTPQRIWSDAVSNWGQESDDNDASMVQIETCAAQMSNVCS
jgi:hypothetical protein